MNRMNVIVWIFVAVLAGMGEKACAQRFTDKLDRGLVAVPSSTKGNFVTWRRFGEEYYDVTYNLYRDGQVIASNLRTSNYNDATGGSSSKYQVSAVVRGVEQEKCKSVSRWANQYKDIKMKNVVDRNGNDVTSHYTLNDVTLADVDGDGVSEFIVKRPCDMVTDLANKTAFHHYDCYKLDGTRLWWIDMGPNMLAGADEQWDIVAYDWDMDGRAEILFRGADNMIIHHADGSTTQIGSGADTRWSGIEYTNSGNEYLIYADGETAVPWVKMNYPLARGAADDWGDGYGHRATKHFFGAPFLDGRKASVFLARGVYTKTLMVAYDVDPQSHQLTQRWRWECSTGGPWFGQGYHNYAIADVDWDGRDEIVYGSMVIDDNGKGLSTTGLGHGDAQHCGDLDPYRHGQEQFTCNESSPNMNYSNATTSQIYYRSVGTSDDGRGLCGNFSNSYPGCVGRSVNTGMISTVADKPIPELGDFVAWGDLNNRIYWDGDLCDEVLNSPGTEREAKVEKPGTGRIFTSSGCKMNNWSKNNPGAQGDIFGDWREELVLRTGDNAYLRIYVSPAETKHSIYSLWHDHQYRQAMVWQPLGYNQPPHLSYFLGEMEGITIAPPPLTMTDRTEVANGGTITNEDRHFIVCEPNNTTINVTDGAAPYIVTFNVPSWVQGTVGNNSTVSKSTIKYEYYTCDVTGGAFTGTMRLVKQGDGILNLPAVKNTYSGNTDIWAGTVNFDGELTSSRVWMNRFAELNTSGVYGRSIEMNYASILRPGGEGTKGVMSCDSLIAGFGARVVFDLYSDGLESDMVKASVLKIGTKNWKYGPEFLAPVFEIAGHHAEGETMLAEGKYRLMEVGEISGDISDIIIKGVSGQKATLEYEDGVLYLVVEGIRDPEPIIWTGTESNVWNFANAENFVSVTGDKEIFVEGDKVTFDDNASKFSVEISGDLPADSIVFDNTKAYTLTGQGAITGNAVLVKKNTGKVTITNDNSYIGGNHIVGGTVSVSSLSNANQAKGNLGGVTTNAAKFTIEDGGTLVTTAAVTCGSPIKLAGTDGGVINNSADFNMNKAFSGTKLTKKGSGWLKLYAANSSLTTLSVTSGTVESTVDVPAKNVEMTGGTLNFDGNGTTIITVPEGKSATVNCYGDRSTYNLTLKGGGNVTMYYPLVKGSGWYATRAAFNGNWSAFEGTVKVTGVADDGRFCLNNATGMPKGTFNIPAGYELQNSGKTYKIGQVTGGGSLGATCTFSSSANNTPNTWVVGNDDTNFTFDGKVVSNANFQKIGACKMTVKGAWANTGTVAINAGELHLSTGAVLGTGSLTIAKGAILSGATSTGSLSNFKYTVNGTIQVGTLATSTSGILQFGGKDVTFNDGSTLLLGVNKCATATANGCASIKNIGTLTMNGCIELFVTSGTKLAVGDSIRIFDEVSKFVGNPTFKFPAGYTFDTSRIGEGLLFVALIDGVESVSDEQKRSDSDSYNLQGIKVDENYEGIIIRNGKKYITGFLPE